MILFGNFADLCQNITKPIIGQLCKEEIKKRTEAIFRVAVAFEKFVLKYSKYHLSEARPSKKMTDQKMGELEPEIHFTFVLFCYLDILHLNDFSLFLFITNFIFQSGGQYLSLFTDSKGNQSSSIFRADNEKMVGNQTLDAQFGLFFCSRVNSTCYSLPKKPVGGR